MGIGFVRLNRRENRRSLAIFDREEIAHPAALNIARILQGAVKLAAATRESREFGALSNGTRLNTAFSGMLNTCRVFFGLFVHVSSVLELKAFRFNFVLQKCHPNRTLRNFSSLYKPMVCQTYGLHADRDNDGNRENDENVEDNSGNYKQGVACWIRRNDGNRGNDENPQNSGVQTTLKNLLRLCFVSNIICIV